MPELPEVETVCRGLAGPLTGARILTAKAHRADLRIPIPKKLDAQLRDRAIRKIYRRAKYILIALDNDMALVLHLGMSGRLTLTRDATPLKKHDHISLSFDNGWHARFNDPRRFGVCALIPLAKLATHKLFANLGVEPLADGLTGAALCQIMAGRKVAIKQALLDQKLIVGIGNIYASEALFDAGIHPARAAGTLSKLEGNKLVSSIKKVLNAAIKAGGSSLRDYVQADGELGYFQHHFAVYDKEGQACRGCTCSTTKTGGVHRIMQGGRSTFFCPHKQK